jgi:DNA-binding response OmpR family regulator
MRILVIGHDGRFRQKLRAWLIKQGHDVHDAGGGPDALKLLRRVQYNVVALDLMNGPAFIPEIRRISPNTPVLAISAEPGTRVAVEGTCAGAEACLAKPVDFRTLGNELARLAGLAVSGAPSQSLSLLGDYSNGGKG